MPTQSRGQAPGWLYQHDSQYQFHRGRNRGIIERSLCGDSHAPLHPWHCCRRPVRNCTSIGASGRSNRRPRRLGADRPADEIRPLFSFDPKGGPNGNGALVIAADDRDGLHGWWQKTFPVTGGKHYRFHAVRKVHDVPVRAAQRRGRILWQDAAGKPVPTDEPAVSGYLKVGREPPSPSTRRDRQTDARGWTEVADTYRAPAKATQAVVELHLRWAPPKGRIEWADVSLAET